MVITVSTRTKFPNITDDLNIIKFPNGLTLIHQQILTTPVVVADVWVNVGVTSEPDCWSGMSHFLEHMIFKGSKKVLPGDFDYVVESTGGYTNAATSYDYTHFFITTASQYLPETLPYLGEVLLQAEIPEDEFYLEREVVLEEINCSNDDYDWLTLQAINSNIYRQHPYRKSVLGEEHLLMKNTPHQMRCYHKTYYQPENFNVVLVGNISLDKAVHLVDKNFSNFSVRSECPTIEFDCEPPMIEVRKQELFLPRLEQSRLVMGWMGPGIDDLEGAIALDMLSIILASGRTSRLVKKLREELNLVLDVGCQFSLQKHSSLFTICAYLKAENIEQIENLIRQEIYDLQANPVKETELYNCQKGLCHDYIFSTETPEQLAGLYGYYQILGNARLARKYPEIIKSLTAEKLQSYASHYLSPEYYAVCYVHSC